MTKEASVEIDWTKEFDNAVDVIKQNGKELDKLSNDEKLQLYAHYKQSTIGDNLSKKPGSFDFKAKKKWEEWSKVKGMSKEDAQKKYVGLAKKIVPAAYK
jgi:diazepam-binding inhibitor (GABA receptor modulating acyl-CoA-binding protein)